MKVKSVMTPQPVSVTLPCGRDEVLRVLVKHNKTGVPVLRKDGKKFAGFVTRHDIFAQPEETQVSILMHKNYPTVRPDINVKDVARRMLEHEVFHVPVVDDEGNLLGVVTPTDLLGIIEQMDLSAPIIEYVRRPCVALYEETPLNVAIAVMKLSKLFALPVLDKEARLSGIVTDRDIFNLTVVDGNIAISDLGLGDDEDDWTWEGLRNVMKLYYEVSKVTLPDKKVREVMVRDPVSIFEKTTVSEAARLMLRNDFGQLPIRNSEDRLKAMVYDLDIVSALL